MTSLSYAAITPARDEFANLRRIAACLVEQTIPPEAWVIVDGGSSDGSTALVHELAESHAFIRVVTLEPEAGIRRGGPIVRAFRQGLGVLEHRPDVIVKLDADLSFQSDYFERLLAAFVEEPRLGIASGSAFELDDGMWRQRHMTRSSVWGACRAYRRECLDDVSPLEERMGWDSIDEFKANVRGWTTATLLDLPFRHHRREGERDGARWRAWATQGDVAHYLGYRASYLVARALYRAVSDVAALSMLWGYAAAAARRKPRSADLQARAYLREQQRLRTLPLRARESLGLRSAASDRR